MGLLTPGYWPSTYWPENYWINDYWTNYGVPQPTIGTNDTGQSRTTFWLQKLYLKLLALTKKTSKGSSGTTATTIDLNQAAGTYLLFTGTTQTVVLEKLAFRMPNVDISLSSLTSISIHTDDATAAVLINTTDGALANLTQEASLSWDGALLIPVGTLVQLTIAGGASGVTCACDIVAESRPVVAEGELV